MKITDLNYKKAEINKRFSIQPDWLMSSLNEFDLKPLDKLLYLCLYQHADVDTGLCYPSYRILKEYTGVVNNSSIKAGLDRLYEAGLVQLIKKGHYEERINMANTYKVKFPYPDDWLICERSLSV